MLALLFLSLIKKKVSTYYYYLYFNLPHSNSPGVNYLVFTGMLTYLALVFIELLMSPVFTFI